jgi:hypothetical protein
VLSNVFMLYSCSTMPPNDSKDKTSFLCSKSSTVDDNDARPQSQSPEYRDEDNGTCAAGNIIISHGNCPYDDGAVMIMVSTIASDWCKEQGGDNKLTWQG